MIIDLHKFIEGERRGWNEMEEMLDRLEREPERRLTLAEAGRLHYLYQKVSSDLARISTFASEPDLRRYLESLTARAYGEIHETRKRGERFAVHRWFLHRFPAVFRKHVRLFWLSIALLMGGTLFGGIAVAIDQEAKEVMIPFEHLGGSPSDRVHQEETAGTDRMKGAKSTFAGYLMKNNIHVSIFALALGMTWGVGTAICLFYNGVILGAVAADYILDGQSVFLLGWLLPHGVIEIPAILIAGQAGLLIGRTLIGRGDRTPLRARLRAIGDDVAYLVLGLSVMLVWAGIIESFMSQYHAPVLPYSIKIAFGCAELVLLIWFLGFHAKRAKDSNS